MAFTRANAPLTCLICGSDEEATSEHIVPQTLWLRFGLDPNHKDLERYRTTLCRRHNEATGKLHRRTEVIELIENGGPFTKKSLGLLADWAVWVTVLLGLSTGEGVLPGDEARSLLRARFDEHGGGLPRGIRVYAARVSEYVRDTTFTSYMVAVEKDRRTVLDYRGTPIGFLGIAGPVTVTESIGLGKIALLVLSRTYPSGVGHNDRLDAAATTVGMERIHPPAATLPILAPRAIDMTALSEVFMPVPDGQDWSLLPDGVKFTLSMFTPADG
ncbi:hypothetical protein [Mycolicibacterium sp. 120270]|uniref:hypothetical protein n=1 Tax=Mycolicibacterium sp. 120270 TaxID=3090600 RepID=UPI00299F1E83|nr:hypothetical protein [Mycolicibacterium sp. 120270]MDX1883879.1 hypothetical protein [Mycolicibacterium sp. 120270]